MLEYDELKRQCTELFQQGKIPVSNSLYATPIVMVRTLDGSVRVCIYRHSINERIISYSLPLSRIDDFIKKLEEARCITHLDLRSTYNQVRMSNGGPTKDSIATTTFKVLHIMVHIAYWKY